MKRTPIMITATVAGLAGVLAFHTTPPRVSLGALPTPAGSQAAPSGEAATGSPATPAAAGSTATPASGTSGTSKATKASGGTRTAVGPGVNYTYGVVSVKVTVSGSKLTSVGIASIDDGGNPLSESIDQQAIPVLEREAGQAQGASIQGVSGASYTSEGFTQSLQAALHSLGFQ